MTSTYIVKGMTCGHCVESVTKEIGAVSGVSGVEVDLESGKVTVASDARLDDQAIEAAVEEAGFELVRS